jgi:hypothetical protein
MTRRVAAILICSMLLAGCATTTENVLDVGDKSQLERRAFQSRIFDTNDKDKVLRATITTLQDLGFVIDRADIILGAVSATKVDPRYRLRISVSVRPRGEKQMTVRANAQHNVQPVDDPKRYQEFFTSLERSLFLTAHLGE